MSAVQQVRVTFSQNSGVGSLVCDNASIGIQAGSGDAYDTTETPVQLKFAGVSGFTLEQGTSITSDWIDLEVSSTTGTIFTSSNSSMEGGWDNYSARVVYPIAGSATPAVIVMDILSGNVSYRDGISGVAGYYKSASKTYATANVAGLTGPYGTNRAQAVTKIETRLKDSAPPAPGEPVAEGLFNVKAYGAVGDGTTDDTIAIQAAITAAVTGRRGGTVYFPIGKYKITSTVTLPDPDGGFQNSISMRGDGPTLTELVWAGPSTGDAAVMFNVLGQAYCSYRNFGMRNGTGAGRAATYGFWFHGDVNSGGTTGGSVIFEHVMAAGFHVGMMIGDGLNAISELLFHMPVFNDCDVGLSAVNFNTLDLTFLLLELGQNGIGIKADSAGCVQFFGGSSSHSTDTDFYFSTGGSFTINGFRSEHANRFVRNYTGTLSLQACTVSACTNADHVSIETSDLLSIVGCKIYDKIVSVSNNSVGITGSYIGNAGDSGDQLIYPKIQGSLDLTHLYAFGNWGIGGANGSQPFSSRASILNASNVEQKAWTIGTVHP